MVKNLFANAGDVRDTGSIPGSGKSPGEGNGNPHQYACLVNPVDRGAWRATVHSISKSRTELKHLSTHTQLIRTYCIGNCTQYSVINHLHGKESRKSGYMCIYN